MFVDLHPCLDRSNSSWHAGENITGLPFLWRLTESRMKTNPKIKTCECCTSLERKITIRFLMTFMFGLNSIQIMMQKHSDLKMNFIVIGIFAQQRRVSVRSLCKCVQT